MLHFKYQFSTFDFNKLNVTEFDMNGIFVSFFYVRQLVS